MYVLYIVALVGVSIGFPFLKYIAYVSLADSYTLSRVVSNTTVKNFFKLDITDRIRTLLAIVYFLVIPIGMYYVNFNLFDNYDYIYLMIKSSVIFGIVILSFWIKPFNAIYSIKIAKENMEKRIVVNSKYGKIYRNFNPIVFYSINKFVITFVFLFILSIYLDFVLVFYEVI